MTLVAFILQALDLNRGLKDPPFYIRHSSGGRNKTIFCPVLGGGQMIRLTGSRCWAAAAVVCVGYTADSWIMRNSWAQAPMQTQDPTPLAHPGAVDPIRQNAVTHCLTYMPQYFALFGHPSDSSPPGSPMLVHNFVKSGFLLKKSFPPNYGIIK